MFNEKMGFCTTKAQKVRGILTYNEHELFF